MINLFLVCCVKGPSHVGNGVLAREGMLDMIIAMADSGSAVHVVSWLLTVSGLVVYKYYYKT